VLQVVAVCCRVFSAADGADFGRFHVREMRCRVLECVAICFCVSLCVFVCLCMYLCVEVWRSVWHCVAICYRSFSAADDADFGSYAVRGNELQGVAVGIRVL